MPGAPEHSQPHTRFSHHEYTETPGIPRASSDGRWSAPIG
jgi:hypothetical protein